MGIVMSQESMIQTQVTYHAKEITRLSQALNQTTINLAILAEKQTTLIEKLDSFFDNSWPAIDERLKKLESHVLMTQERQTLIKSLYRLWPFVITLVFMSFLIGVIKADDVKAVHEIKNHLGIS